MKVLVVLAMLFAVTTADLYLHNPPGANNRNRERNDNRNNADKMMDSQNNGKGGYPWAGNATSTSGDPMIYYVGSILPIEWTLQHSCGPGSNAWCNVIVQYACEDTMPNLRDGYPQGDVVISDNQNPEFYLKRLFASAQQDEEDGTNTIPCPNANRQGWNCPNPNFNDAQLNDATNTEDLDRFYAGEQVNNHIGMEFGLHESWDYYLEHCLKTSRNMGLYNADQDLNGNSARYTRQNPNGNRRGLECPEERDYYPFWRYSPWKDIAVLVSDTEWCDFFVAESQNVKSRFHCEMPEQFRLEAPFDRYPIDEDTCFANGGTWTEIPSHNIPAPECKLHPASRDNHLGNTVEVDSRGNPTLDTAIAARYWWTVPEDASGQKCVIRVRYNMSTDNYPAVNSFQITEDGEEIEDFIDWRFNCPEVSISTGETVDDISYEAANRNLGCSDVLTANSRPLINRPYISVFGEENPELSLAINTHQTSRTFQDRSYVFSVEPMPTGRDVPSCDRVFNLNNRGRRGNIVQCYPAVEYDFVPEDLEMTTNDCVHIQFLGSDFNAAKNPNNGEGWRFSSRFNMVQLSNPQTDFPQPASEITMWPDMETAMRMAYVDQDMSLCEDFIAFDDNEQNHYSNCGKLNAAPNHFDGGIHKFAAGEYDYVCTRNNNFSNRSQKGRITVTRALNAGGIAGITVGAVVGVVAIAGGIFFIRSRR
jgi:hypothetical protein